VHCPFFLSEIFEADLLLSFLNAQRSWSASCQSSAKLLSLPAEWFVRQAGFRVLQEDIYCNFTLFIAVCAFLSISIPSFLQSMVRFL
jgi:hypothetical protein